MKVVIEGRDVVPCARLLEALTKAGLLTQDITWEDKGDRIVITVPEPSHFQVVRFRVLQ